MSEHAACRVKSVEGGLSITLCTCGVSSSYSSSGDFACEVSCYKQISTIVLTLMIYQYKENERALIGMTDEAIECEDNKIEAGVGLGIT